MAMVLRVRVPRRSRGRSLVLTEIRGAHRLPRNRGATRRPGALSLSRRLTSTRVCAQTLCQLTARRRQPHASRHFRLGFCGRGSRIRTCDLQYPKLPRYQAALYPAAHLKTRPHGDDPRIENDLREAYPRLARGITLDRRARPLSMQSYRRSRSSARWIHVSTAVSKADDRDG
jgi:hypothetical protein